MKDLPIERPELADTEEVWELVGRMRVDEGAEFVGAVDDIPFRQSEKGLIVATSVVRQGLKFFFTSRSVGSAVDGAGSGIAADDMTGGW